MRRRSGRRRGADASHLLLLVECLLLLTPVRLVDSVRVHTCHFRDEKQFAKDALVRLVLLRAELGRQQLATRGNLQSA